MAFSDSASADAPCSAAPAPRRGETTVLGDEIYFNYVYGQLELSDSWIPHVRMLRYFRNFSRATLLRIASTEYVNPSYFQQKDKRFAPVNNDFYHLSTGGYGIVFRVEEYVVKFVFEPGSQFHPMDLTSEYTVPRFLYNNLQGDERLLVVRALAMGLNYKIGFLHTLYKRVLHMVLLLARILDGQPLSLAYSRRQVAKLFAERKDSAKFVRLLSYFYPAVIKSNLNVINHFGHMIHFFEHEKRANYTYDRGNIIVFPLARCSAEKVTAANCAEFGFASVVHYVKFLFLQMALLYIKIYELSCHNFIHVDLKPDNILLFDSERELRIHVGERSYVFREPVRSALNDFDFSQVSEIPNKKITASLRVEQNWFYDFHFFAHTLLKVYPELERDAAWGKALGEFLVCCNRNTCEKFRLRVRRLHPISFLVRFVARDLFSDWINGEPRP
ncbi:MC017 [Molluscum contagiosum virus subtype 2]|uniref:Serine/threonine-protein kinase n=2 Tax=Molluscum contagiosum virus TaxID=10279 RepID=A0A1S7DLL3_MCV2|nr:MC017 [Molluscum contagiosum virus subtype 2]QHW16401.1 MC017L [Molluscum contagiosum virus]AYO87650.1 MC017 [Molluscum contagiosum virus subtype 2]AYO87820.1 MC017 [Molluscum contagiosum virus subtype 2]AYO87990.1 MC017 [Molluscum contagiosum virus subtype 2]